MGKNNVEQLKFAQSFLGKGGATFRKYCGLGSGTAYCDAFVTYVFHKSDNANLFCNGKKQTYCPNTIKILQKELAQIPPYIALPSDIILFDWEKNGVPNHIGFVRARKDTTSIYTTEGNTSGGIVANMVRNCKYVQAIFRPHFKATYKLGKLTVDGECGYNTIAVLQKYLGVTVDGILGLGTVKALQKKVGVTADGAWGKATSKAVQKMVGTTVDGAFGKNSVKALQTFLNNKVYPKSSAPKPAAPKPATPTRTKMIKIGHARADYDHKAGDSSGKEVCKTKFTYNPSNGSVYDWTYVFRPKDIAKANKAADMCEKAIANNNIGYNSHGETAYGKAKAMTKLAKAAGYDLSKIKTKCGLSCGDLICLCNQYAGLSKCYQGSGKALAAALKKNSNFQCLGYKKGMQLYRGDVLITAHSNGKNNHVVMCL